ncbi:flagellar basal body-associated FliL family protein [Sulfurospirillum sp. 1612]|uniref:flagellar basal body-associated FliL family protein n=1 Tax=Sulfurospirillum sp. 1612 TaxID=3094835 RepID=UPI002F9324EF
MKKIMIFLVLCATVGLYAQMLHVDDFSSEVFSKVKKKPVSISISLVFDGRDVEEEHYKIIDALNIIIGSFYFEDLVTSQGKENMKKAIIKYCSNKYGVDIDHIYIQKMNALPSTQQIIDALKKEGMCVKDY